MKTRILSSWMAGLLAMSLSLVSGCSQESGALAPQTTAANNPDPVVAPLVSAGAVATASAASTNAVGTDANPITEFKPPAHAAVPTNAATADKPLPADMLVTPSLREVVKMANAGIDSTVILTFVTNSAGTFNLGSDQIIYLNDLGVPNPVITAMIQRDQVLLSAAGALTASSVPMPGTGVVQQAAGFPTDAAVAETAAVAPPAPAYVAAPPVAEVVPPPAPAVEVVNDDYFRTALSPYGNWLYEDGYGWCWQPTIVVANSGWRPYCDGGRWIYTDYGWYWNSDYSWGGIAFHYGRWFSHPRWGWCWWPDNRWGPSWVTWRNSDLYCGWAPLPPFTHWTAGIGFTYRGGAVDVGFGFGLGLGYYTFVPWGRVCDVRPSTYRLGHDRVVQIYDRSTVINNIVIGDHNTVVNRGIGLERVPPTARTGIRRAVVRDDPTPADRIAQPDRVGRESGRLVVYRPTPPTSTDSPRSSVGTQPTRADRTGRNPARVETARTPDRPTVTATEPKLARTEVISPVRSPQPTKITDPIVRPQPTLRARNLMDIELVPRGANQNGQKAGNQGHRRTVVRQDPAADMLRNRAAATQGASPTPQTPAARQPIVSSQPDANADRFVRRPLPRPTDGAGLAPSQPMPMPQPAPAPPPNTYVPPTRPSYTPPAAPAYEPPARPSYSPPAVRSEPSYAPPPTVSRPAPDAAPSRPAPSSDSRSSSSGDSRPSSRPGRN